MLTEEIENIFVDGKEGFDKVKNYKKFSSRICKKGKTI